MAKHRIRKGQTPSKLAEQYRIPERELREANRGVVTFKPGQVVNIPPAGRRLDKDGNTNGNDYKFKIPFAPPNPFTPPPPPQNVVTASPGLPPSPVAFFPGTPTTPPQQNIDPRFNAGRGQNANFASQNNGRGRGDAAGRPQNMSVPTPADSSRSSFYTDARFQQPKTQPYLGSSSYLDPRWQPAGEQAAGEQAAGGQAPPPRPEGAYVPGAENAQQWLDYWNFMARNPAVARAQNPAQPRVMTRDEIWEMKAAQRRRTMEKMSPDEMWSSAPFSAYDPYAVPEQQGQGQAQLVRPIVWGI